MPKLSRRAFTQSVAAGAATVAAGPTLVANSPTAHAADTPGHLIGTGIHDITGAIAQTGAFGYAAGQEMDGLHQRLYAHAFIIGSLDGSSRVVFVSVDLGAVFQSVKMAVIAKLASRFGSLYTDDNVLLSATHTHVGSAGHSHDKLYQIASNDGAGYGYDQRNFSAAVDGIVEAIAKAHASLEPGTITLQRGDLTGATKNRSVEAYRANEDAAQFDSDVNTEMVQLKLTATDGTPRGLLNWFAIHPTSFSMKFTQISGDNKGYAQYFFEQQMGSRPTDRRPFVAAFAQCDEGDVVSSHGNAFSSPGYQGSSDEFANAEVDGSRQLAKAQELFDTPGTQLAGPVDVRGRWINFADYTVGAKFAGGTAQKLPRPARGWSFAVGAENGPSDIPGLYEGMTQGSFSPSSAAPDGPVTFAGSLVRMAFATANNFLGSHDPAQAEKAILLPTGMLGWAPLQVQVQVMRIGSLAIVAVPGEATTMAGRRIRRVVLDALAGTGVTTAVIAGLSNQYLGYITTREEYAMQHYEGASTEFGPHQLGALLQEYEALATGLRTGQPTPGVAPRRSGSTPPSRPGVVLDDKPPAQQFGDVLVQPEGSYSAGQSVSAVFRGGHPKNNLRTMGTFLTVQRRDGDRWVDVLDDHDWDTSYTWKREGASYSRCTVTWRIRRGTKPGTYRLVQTGDWKNGWNGAISQYRGVTREFTVV